MWLLLLFGAWLAPSRSHAQDPAAAAPAANATEPAPGAAAPPPAETSDLAGLSLTELLDVPVVTANRHPTRHMETPAAVFILTREDIRRSGARTIPDLLRLVPGVQVAQVNTATPAVSIRGFAQEYATKLLVLVDGRSIYTPVFSGVFWMEQELMLEDIERIEVIRGPGAAVWGANAVNGVINIITRHSADTQGTLVSAGGGNVERAFGAARYGGQASTNTHYRIWARAFNRDGLDPAKPGVLKPGDDWQGIYSGVRMDTAATDRDAVMLSGTAFDQRLETDSPEFSPQPPYLTPQREDWVNAGGHLLGRWTHTLDEISDVSIQAYLDNVERDNPYTAHELTTTDVEAIWHGGWNDRHRLTAGLGYRYVDLNFDDSDFTFSWDTPYVEEALYSSFVQYDLAVVRNRLHVIAGTKVEHFDSVGWELEPTLRTLYTPHKDHTLWAAVSRAARTPSVYNQYGRRVIELHPPGTDDPDLPTFVVQQRGENPVSEDLLAWEAGYRAQPAPRVWIDLVGFVNDYETLVTHSLTDTRVVTGPAPYWEEVETTEGLLYGETYGGELTGTWQVYSGWRLQAAYSVIEMDLTHQSDDQSSADWTEGRAPENQIYLRSLWDVTRDVDCDVALRYVDPLVAIPVGSYLECDVHVAWRPRADLELSLVGQNLIDAHQEYGNVEVGPSVYGMLTWMFD